MTHETRPISSEEIIIKINEKIQNSNKSRWNTCKAIEIGNRPGYENSHILWVTKFDGDCSVYCQKEINEQIVAPLSDSYHLQ